MMAHTLRGARLRRGTCVREVGHKGRPYDDGATAIQGALSLGQQRYAEGSPAEPQVTIQAVVELTFDVTGTGAATPAA